MSLPGNRATKSLCNKLGQLLASAALGGGAGAGASASAGEGAGAGEVAGAVGGAGKPAIRLFDWLNKRNF